jgi:hypothetical protein
MCKAVKPNHSASGISASAMCLGARRYGSACGRVSPAKERLRVLRPLWPQGWTVRFHPVPARKLPTEHHGPEASAGPSQAEVHCHGCLLARKLTASSGHLKEAPGYIQTRRLAARLVGARPAYIRHLQATMVRLWMPRGTARPMPETRRQKSRQRIWFAAGLKIFSGQISFENAPRREVSHAGVWPTRTGIVFCIRVAATPSTWLGCL